MRIALFYSLGVQHTESGVNQSSGLKSKQARNQHEAGSQAKERILASSAMQIFLFAQVPALSRLLGKNL
jgi:hypothetical protein